MQTTGAGGGKQGLQNRARNLSDPIALVQARCVALSNALSGYDLPVDGQERLMAVPRSARDTRVWRVRIPLAFESG